MEELILRLANINPRHQRDFGSKAVNLGVIARKSRTAPGFCLSSEAYFQALIEAGVMAEVARHTAGVSAGDMERINIASQEICGIIKDLKLPAGIEASLEVEYQVLVREREGIKVAVRSSATAEDLPSASFAGQMESFLNIASFPEVRKAVISCWCSLWSPRAIHYRLQRGASIKS